MGRLRVVAPLPPLPPGSGASKPSQQPGQKITVEQLLGGGGHVTSGVRFQSLSSERGHYF